jgi:hypothetical protein
MCRHAGARREAKPGRGEQKVGFCKTTPCKVAFSLKGGFRARLDGQGPFRRQLWIFNHFGIRKRRPRRTAAILWWLLLFGVASGGLPAPCEAETREAEAEQGQRAGFGDGFGY